MTPKQLELVVELARACDEIIKPGRTQSDQHVEQQEAIEACSKFVGEWKQGLCDTVRINGLVGPYVLSKLDDAILASGLVGQTSALSFRINQTKNALLTASTRLSGYQKEVMRLFYDILCWTPLGSIKSTGLIALRAEFIRVFNVTEKKSSLFQIRQALQEHDFYVIPE